MSALAAALASAVALVAAAPADPVPVDPVPADPAPADAASADAVDATPANAVTLEPLAVVFAKTIALEYERRLVSGVSVALGPVVTRGDTTTGGDTPVTGDYEAWGATLSLRFYPWSPAPSGAFIGPFAGLAWAEATAGDAASSGLGWSVGGLAGYTWILGKYFVFSVGGGAAWLDLAIDSNGSTKGKRGVYPALRLAIGGAF